MKGRRLVEIEVLRESKETRKESRASGALTQKQYYTTWAWGKHGLSNSGPQKNIINGTISYGRQSIRRKNNSGKNI